MPHGEGLINKHGIFLTWENNMKQAWYGMEKEKNNSNHGEHEMKVMNQQNMHGHGRLG